MSTLVIALTTARGDELGRIPLERVVLLPPGSPVSNAGRPDLQGQMDAVCAEIVAAVDAAGLQLAADPFELRLIVSRTLLDGAGTDALVVPVPVAATGAPAAGGEPLPADDQPPSAEPIEEPDWNDLFAPLREESQ